MASVPGLPGAHSPTYLTRHQELVSLDTLVGRVCERLAGRQAPVRMARAPVKATIQVARGVVAGVAERGALVTEVVAGLRRVGVLLTAAQVEAVLETFGQLLVEIDVAEVY